MAKPDKLQLAQLDKQLRDCILCLNAGFAITTGAVFSHPPASDVMLIGQAPGITEVEAKRPFNAGSGRRLFQWLEGAGWQEDTFRANYVMTAVTKCYPGKGSNGKGDRVPTKAEQQLCRPFLEGEFKLYRPRLIMPVGGLAIKLFFPASKRLNQIIGTAVYFGPEVSADPLDLNLKHGQRLTEFDPSLSHNGRWLVPLPHPSGASLWPNKPKNKLLIEQAIRILEGIREAWQL
ncbi:MAG: uracil-DNA glycosylase family protein [Candidatus Promineifilaceae bacterium]|jgi:uracil-DNA glycosylase